LGLDGGSVILIAGLIETALHILPGIGSVIGRIRRALQTHIGAISVRIAITGMRESVQDIRVIQSVICRLPNAPADACANGGRERSRFSRQTRSNRGAVHLRGCSQRFLPACTNATAKTVGLVSLITFYCDLRSVDHISDTCGYFWEIDYAERI
jgi:hypothetical protein